MAIYVRDEKGVLQALDIPAYKGEKGEAGITPNLQIGDVTTLESGQQATITRRGDDENPIFDFAIPKGENGEDGIFVGRIEDAPSHAQIVVNDDASPYDLFFENANVSYMGDTYTSLKEKADADIEYLLRKFGTQHYEGSSITATNTYMKRVNSAMFKGVTKYRDKDTGEILEAFEEGRNLELVSVTMPVLTTIGKNLFDEKLHLKMKTEIVDGIEAYVFSGGFSVTDNNRVISDKTFNFKKNTQYTIRVKHKIKSDGCKLYLRFFYTDGSYDNLGAKKDKEWTEYYFTSRPGKTLSHIANDTGSADYIAKGSIGLYEGLASSHEPFKSNILITPQDLVMRSNGNVYDELDLITGKFTQRIDESNEVLAQEVVKTVDLNGQKIYSYDGTTHYITSSLQGHPNPILSIDVPTNTTKMIARQREEIEHQEQKLQEQEEVQNLLIETQLAWFEDNISTLELTDEETPSHIQKLYELTRKYRVEEE